MRNKKLAFVAVILSLMTSAVCAVAQQTNPRLAVRFSGAEEIVFKPGDGCDGHDVPDLAARAFRDASGQVFMFALHYFARPFRGPSFDRLKLDCRVAYDSPGNGDPAAWDAQNWIAATWTRDGVRIEAIVHHEYRAERYRRCTVPATGLACWYNALLAVRSEDGGATFRKHSYPAIAAAPFRQEVQQQRHRGFFNPSNMFSDGRYVYFFAAQTGWAGQRHGVCLFRSADPSAPRNWRAWDGKAFGIRYDDPYRRDFSPPRPCKPVEPFPAQVGAVVRHRPTGTFVAVVQAWKDSAHFPVSGFYYARSRNLLDWSAPRLLMATRTLYDNPCGAGVLNSYPSILDPQAKGRNFDDTGDEAWLYWSSMRVEGCNHTGDRKLLRRRIAISPER